MNIVILIVILTILSSYGLRQYEAIFVFTHLLTAEATSKTFLIHNGGCQRIALHYEFEGYFGCVSWLEESRAFSRGF